MADRAASTVYIPFGKSIPRAASLSLSSSAKMLITGASSEFSVSIFLSENTSFTLPEAIILPCAITIDKHSPLLGKSIKSTDIRNKWHCLVIGLERGSYTIVNPNISLVFEKDDLLWILGKQKMINQLVRDEIL